jgi:hypothetical protein
MAALCAQCGAKRSHSVHLKALGMEGNHPYLDASKAGLKPISDPRAEYQRSAAHQKAYEGAHGVCAFEAAGAPTECQPGPITPHHTFPRGRSGSLERSERVAPVVPACAFHNTWVSQDAEGIAWGESHLVTVGGRDWHLLMTDAEARQLEATNREFKPASPLLSIEGETK